MSYNVGDLNLNIQSVSDTTISSLDEVIKKLTIINSMLKTTTKTSASGSIANAASNDSKKSGQSVAKTLNFGVMVTKLKMATYFIKRLGDGLATVVQYGSDYTETLNKWQVAMRYNIDDADTFIKKMRTAYGISTEMLMDTQSTFKNLLSGLGGISEATSYQLSESVTQMMLDFASLYNQTIESASSKFQAMISGQIRPVRSVSGIDVSETSIYDLYTRLGGTKTMRQLNQMEKRLLRIYATFEQMQSAGATGDFAKTIEQWANQSRIMTENWQELVTWLGIGLKELLESANVLQYVNAALLTATEIVKAIVYASGYEDENFLNGFAQGAEDTNEAIDGLQGKLLDFDKFRTLESNANGGILAIDQVVLDALASYNSQLENANYKAQEIADVWLKSLGLIDENGDGILDFNDKLKSLLDTLKAVGISLGIFTGYAIVKGILGIITKVTGLNAAISLLNMALVGGLVYSIIKAVEAFKECDYWGGVLYTLLGVTMVVGLILLNKKFLVTSAKGIATFITSITKATVSTKVASNGFLTATSSLSKLNIATGVLAGVLGFLVVDQLLSGLGEDARSIVAPIMLAVGAVVAITTAILALKGVLTWGVGLPILLASIGVAVAGVKSMIPTNIDAYANGGMPDKGSLFIAGEAGAEIVYNTSSGQSGVANIDQIAQAQYKANMMFWQQAKKDLKNFGNVTISADSQGIFKVVTDTAQRQGKVWAKA